jgi:hypothetical protein
MFFAACSSVSSMRALRPAWLVAKALQSMQALIAADANKQRSIARVRIGAGIVIRRGQARAVKGIWRPSTTAWADGRREMVDHHDDCFGCLDIHPPPHAKKQKPKI